MLGQVTDPQTRRAVEDLVRSEAPGMEDVVAVVDSPNGTVVLFSETRPGEFGVAICRQIGGEWALFATNGGFEAECAVWVVDPVSSDGRGVGVYCRHVGRSTVSVVSGSRRVEAQVVGGWVVAFDWDVSAEDWSPESVHAP
jgi:hypothetical protein